MDKEDRKYKKQLAKLSDACFIFLRRLDEVMKMPSEGERGKAIAKISNALELINDSTRYSFLGVDFRTDDKDEIWRAIRRKVLEQLAKE